MILQKKAMKKLYVVGFFLLKKDKGKSDTLIDDQK